MNQRILNVVYGVLIVILSFVVIYLVIANHTLRNTARPIVPNGDSSAINKATTTDSQTETAIEEKNLKVYSGAGFTFKYPTNWYLDVESNSINLSPNPIEYYDIGSDSAPIYLQLINPDDTRNFTLEQIKGKQYTATTINGGIFKRYDFIDETGSFEGSSGGRAVFFISPEFISSGEKVQLGFRWIEKPAGKTVANNNLADFEEIIATVEIQ